MSCSGCGHQNPTQAKFCLECGMALSRACAGCGTGLPAGAKFCLECGRSTAGAAGRTEAAWRAVSAVLLSDALLLGGDLTAAQTAANNAITLCRTSLRASYEAEAQGVLARALLRRDGRSGCEAAETALTEAAALIESSGAVTLAPWLCEWRAELAEVLGDDVARKQQLRQAHDLYREIGAPAQAERLASDLADPRPAT